MESALVHLGRSNTRLLKTLGITGLVDINTIKFHSDYLSVLVGLKEAYNPSTEEIVGKAKKGNRLKLIPNIEVNPSREYLLVQPNKALEEFADIPGVFLIAPNSGDAISFYAKFHKECDLSSLDYIVRIMALS